MNNSTRLSSKGFITLIGSSLVKTVLSLTMMLLLVSATAHAQSTYYWRGTTNDDWNTATNWNTISNGSGTTRSAPLSTDILIFDASIGATIPNPISFKTPGLQTIGQLRFVNNVTVNLTGPTTNNNATTLDISGGAAAAGGDDFFVQVGSTFNLVYTANTSNRYLIVAIGTGKKGLIAGNVSITAAANVPSRFLVADAGGLLVASGGIFTVNINGTSANPFGSTDVGSTDATTANAVTFASGSTFFQYGGLDPFSSSLNPITTFQSSSRYLFGGGTFSPEGHAYGILEFTASTTVSGSQPLTVTGELRVTAGGVNINVVGTGTTVGSLTGVGGNLTFAPATNSSLLVTGSTYLQSTIIFNPTLSFTATFSRAVLNNAGALTFGGVNTDVNFARDVTNNGTLTFSQSNPSSVTFNGTVGQLFDGSNAATFGAQTQLVINNTGVPTTTDVGGATLGRTVTLARGLVLTRGLLTTSSVNPVVLQANATVTGANATSFVNGPIVRVRNSGAGALLFPVGKTGASGTSLLLNYRPMTLNITGQTTTVTYTGEQIEMSAAAAAGVEAALHHVSFKRYFSLVPDAPIASGSGYNATLTLTFDTDDFVNFPGQGTFVVAQRVGTGVWMNISRSGFTGTANNGLPVAGTLTSGPIMSLSANGPSFSLASTVPSVGFPGVNPLPVVLTSFTATTKANGIAVDWATASEKNSAYFEVQRSADSENFKSIAKVQAQGNSTAAHVYASLDRTPLGGLGYYRLRQMDLDGTETFSPVVTARWNGTATLEAYPNPTTGTIFLGGVSGKVQFRVLSTQGKALLAGETTSSEGVNVKALPAGIYLLEVMTESGRNVQRFVRE